MPMIRDDLIRQVVVYVCKDRTLSYHRLGSGKFIDSSLPVFSVRTDKEAERLVVAVGQLQHAKHPLLPPDRPWYKVDLGLDKIMLKLDDLGDVSDKLRDAYAQLRAHADAEEAANG